MPRFLAVILALALLSGCVVTRFTLIPPDQARIDRAYLGDFEALDSAGHHTSLLVRNLDNKQYYVETQAADADKPTRYVGFLAPVAGGTFAHLREIRDDGVVSEDWMLLRLDLVADKLTIRPLSADFFKKQAIDSAGALRQFIAANVDNHELYDHNAALVATRVQ